MNATTIAVCLLLVAGLAFVPGASADIGASSIIDATVPGCNAGEPALDCIIRLTIEFCKSLTSLC